MTTETDATAIRVAIADDSYLVREALTHVLDAAGGVEVIAACDDRDSLQRAIEAHRPDVVVIMNPIYRDEIQAALADIGVHPERIVSIEAPPPDAPSRREPPLLFTSG